MEFFGILIILGFIFFFGWASSVEKKETYKAAIRSIEKDIKSGILIKLSDGRIVETASISIADKRLTSNYVFLLTKGKYYETQLDFLSLDELLILATKEKNEEAKLKREVLESQMRKQREEEERIREQLRMEQERKEKQEKLELWLNLRTDLKGGVSTSSFFEGVYVIYCQETHDFYIGSSINVGQRLKQHLYSLRNSTHSTFRLLNDFQKFGESRFSFYLIYTLDDYKNDFFFNKELNIKEKLERLEQQAIDKYSPKYNVYKDIKQAKFDHYNKLRK